jgi:hypothetical protein
MKGSYVGRGLMGESISPENDLMWPRPARNQKAEFMSCGNCTEYLKREFSHDTDSVP